MRSVEKRSGMVRGSVRRGVAVLIVAAVALAALMASPAAAAPGDAVVAPEDLAVTFVARTCSDYTAIMANRARNNIQESLRDLGPDSTYRAGQPIAPAVEDAGSPTCTPLSDWSFQLGTAITGKTEATDWLSVLRGTPFPDSVRTQAGPIPELDARGVDTGRTISGATTVVLSGDAAAWVRQGRQLWAQGGTQSAPLPASGQYGFGALRCSVDNNNGDNVEYVSFPTIAGVASRHVFCYYYAVTPPPEAGTITVVKELSGVSGGGAERFTFEGNISYDRPSESDPGRFVLSPTAQAPASTTFVRGAVPAGGEPWSFRELARDGWEVTGTPNCVTDPAVDSPWTYTPETGFSVSLRADDQVVCTIANTKTVTASLQKTTVGGIGTFPFDVETPDTAYSTSVTTTAERTPVLVDDTPVGSPGLYVATETLPTADAFGAWSLESGICLGGNAGISNAADQASLEVTVLAGETVNCLMTNRYTPNGAITIAKTSIGGVGEFNYTITPTEPSNESDDTYTSSATTTAEDQPVTATPSDGSPPAENLALGSRWTIQEHPPAPTAEGFWQVIGVDCGSADAVVDVSTGTVTVAIPEPGGAVTSPVVACDYVNAFVPLSAVQVIKNTTADTALRPDPAQITWTCGAQRFTVVIPPGESISAEAPVEIIEGTTCVVTEDATGAAEDVDVTTSASLVATAGSEPVDYELGQPFTLVPGETSVVTIDNTFSAPEPPITPTPTSPAPTPTSGALPGTGNDWNPAPWVLAATLAVMIGCALVALRRRRH